MVIYLYMGFLALTAAERLVEMVVSKRHAEWAFARGGKEFGRSHFPFMVVLHTLFLLGCAIEPWVFEREFNPIFGAVFLIIAIACQALRWWVITTLGPRWNTRVIVVPGLDRIKGGPFQFLSHPNYLAVVIEGIALPMIFGSYLTAITFSVLNAGLLFVRIRCEEQALDWAAAQV